jgi:hypothetical protein
MEGAKRPSLSAVADWAQSARLHTDSPNHNKVTRAINTLRRGERLRKSMQQLTSSGLAPKSDEIRTKLLSKIPRADKALIDVEESGDNVVQLEIEDDEIILEVLELWQHCGCGLYGCHTATFYRCISCESAQMLPRDVINLLLKGEAPPRIQPYLAGGVLVAFNKSGEVVGGDVRPIVMGNISEESQLKFFVKWKKKTTISHHIRKARRGAAIERYNLPTKWVLVKIDLKNAFNLVSREQVLLLR